MRAHITITDNNGAVLEGTVDLVRQGNSAKASRREAQKVVVRANSGLSFSSNSLAFMKKHGKGLSGPRRFTLLLANLTKGEMGKELPGQDIKTAWNRMKPVMGGKYNGAYANRAKAEGWVDQPKHAHYSLSSAWREAASAENE